MAAASSLFMVFGADMLSPACVEVTTGSLQPVRIKADGCFAPVINSQVLVARS